MKVMREFFKEEDGMGVIEIVLIIVVLISLVLLFKNQLTALMNTLLVKIKNKAGTV